MNIQFVRLDDEVCEALNRLAEQEKRTVSALVNQVLKEFLNRHEEYSAEARQ
jgi:predicted transcriptional regulator